MKIFYLLTLITFFFIETASSQTQQNVKQKFKFGLGCALSFSTGSLKTYSDFGLGFEVTGIYNFSNKLAGFIQTGSDFLFIKDTANKYEMTGWLKYHMPFITGMRFNMGSFFGSMGVGYGLWYSDSPSSNGFLYSPQIGYQLNEHYHFILHYTSTLADGNNRSYFGLKAFHTF